MDRRQRSILIALSVVVAATRLLPLARSMWDWDEALFCLALHDFNVAAHHPHPPGFPLYIALGRIARTVIHDDFRALQSIQLIASLFLFPVMVALGRAMRFPFAVAISGATLLVFLPNVWFYGGTAFSDILNLTLLLAGLALLFAGREDRSRYFAGTFVFSLSLLVRPQNVLCAYAWLAASWKKRPRDIAAGALLSIVVVAAGYGIAAKATGWRAWIDNVAGHGHYITTVDGFRNPGRTPSLRLFPLFAIDPFEGGRAPRVVFAFALIALLVPKRRDAEVVATFFPALVFAMFLLNPTGASRLSLGYMPMHALLAADGVERVAVAIATIARRPRIAVAVQALCVAALAGRFIAWCIGPFGELRRNDSPPVAAMKWVRQHIPPGSTLFIDDGFGPHAEYYLKSYDEHFVENEDDLAKMPFLRNAWYLGNRNSDDPEAVNFRRPRKKLYALFTRRYFESCVSRTRGAVAYLEGWYGEESDGRESWRWMGRQARVRLQAIPAGGELRFTATLPLDAERPPLVTISIDGREIDRFTGSPAIARRYQVPPSAAPHDVVFTVGSAVNPQRQHLSGDARDLGLQLRTLTWKP